MLPLLNCDFIMLFRIFLYRTPAPFCVTTDSVFFFYESESENINKGSTPHFASENSTPHAIGSAPRRNPDMKHVVVVKRIHQ